MSTRIHTAPRALRAGRPLLRVRGFLRTAAMFISALALPLAGASAQSGDDSRQGRVVLQDQQARRLLRGAAGRHRRRARGHRHDPAGDGAAALRQSVERLARGRLCLSAAGAGGGRSSGDGDRRPAGHRRDQGAAGGQGDLSSRRRPTASMPAWWRASGPTSSPPRSPISGRARRSRWRSSIRTTCISMPAPTACASPWWWVPATSRAGRSQQVSADPDQPAPAAGHRVGRRTRTGCRTPAASRRRCCSRARARSIRCGSPSTSRRASRRSGSPASIIP